MRTEACVPPWPNNKCPSPVHLTTKRQKFTFEVKESIVACADLVVLLQLALRHDLKIISRECAQKQIALQRASLSGLVHQSSAKRFDGLVVSRQGADAR